MFCGFLKRILAFLILIFLMEGTLRAQQNALCQNISVKFHNIPVDSALKILEKKIHLDFTYNSDLIPGQKKFTATFDSIPLAIILDSLLQRPLIQYRIIENQLILYEKKNPVHLPASGFGQQKIITGKIIDDITKKALAFSSVSILHKPVGVISNEDGYFVFKVPSRYKNDTLVISRVGYYLHKIPIREIRGYKSYKMYERTVSLPEILIRSTSPTELVRHAILKIPVNYFTGPYLMRSFYREIIKRNKRYLSYTEAILDFYKRPMRPTLFHDEVKMVKERKYIDINSRDTVMLKLKGGIEAILKLDIIRNPAEFIELNNNRYQYSLIGMEYIEGKLAYVIRFTPDEDQEGPSFEGEMFIDAKTLAILEFRFGYSKKSLKKLKSLFIVKSSRNIKSYPTENSYVVSYQELDGKYYIHHILGTLGLKIKRRKKWLASHYYVTFEMISTDIVNKRPSRFATKQTIKPNRIFSDMIPGNGIITWKNQNTIPPEQNIVKALKKFKLEDLKVRNNRLPKTR